jgi:D-alanine-D-alanine ligase
MPGSLAFYLWEAAGVPLYELVGRMVEIGIARHKARSATRFYFQANLLQRER